MSKELVTLSTIANMTACKKALQSEHNAFPVLNTAGRLVGLIPKRFVVKILEKKSFYDKDSIDRSNYTEIAHPFKAEDDFRNEPLINSTEHVEKSASHEFELTYDEKNGFPPTPPSKVLSLNNFGVDIFSNDADAEHVIMDVIEENFEEWIDLRPYMIENPLSVSQHDKFYKVLDQFRLNHCRHLMVVDPSSGNLAGVVTRKDLFAYNSL